MTEKCILFENKESIDYSLGRVGLNQSFSLPYESSATEFFVYCDMRKITKKKQKQTKKPKKKKKKKNNDQSQSRKMNECKWK